MLSLYHYQQQLQQSISKQNKRTKPIKGHTAAAHPPSQSTGFSLHILSPPVVANAGKHYSMQLSGISKQVNRFI